jgi:hypothetical protein
MKRQIIAIMKTSFKVGLHYGDYRSKLCILKHMKVFSTLKNALT